MKCISHFYWKTSIGNFSNLIVCFNSRRQPSPLVCAFDKVGNHFVKTDNKFGCRGALITFFRGFAECRLELPVERFVIVHTRDGNFLRHGVSVSGRRRVPVERARIIVAGPMAAAGSIKFCIVFGIGRIGAIGRARDGRPWAGFPPLICNRSLPLEKP